MAGKTVQKAAEQQTEGQSQLPYEVRINNVQFNGGSVRAYASVTLGGCFAVDGIRIMEGKKGNFVAMPGYNNGTKFTEVCFPVTKEFREKLYSDIMLQYEQKLGEILNRNNPFDQAGETQSNMGMFM